MTSYQNVPVQTSNNNLMFKLPQNDIQQMQTYPGINYFSSEQGMQEPCSTHFHQFQPNTYQSGPQYTPNIPIPNPLQTSNQHPFASYVSQQNQTSPIVPPQQHNILDQVRSCINNPAPIFILPTNYQQPVQSQQPTPVLSTAPSAPPITSYVPPTVSYHLLQPPPVIPCPSYYPYPIPMPVCDPLARSVQNKEACGCQVILNAMKECPQVFRGFQSCCTSPEQEEHRCMQGNDDTICTKRNCPVSINLQALASQFLSIQGIISCAATRLVLRKIPGSNITTTIEETVEKAMRALSALTKDQLLQESRSAQQVNALINLHMTSNLPAIIIPTLTLIQLKVNLLKSQVEQLINKRLMETQGVGVESTSSIDPAILALKSDEELREFLTTLRQKECEEMIGVNFAPYSSQRVIAETRLSNIRKKMAQVEAEFQTRRTAAYQKPSFTARTIQEFADTAGALGFGYSYVRYPMRQDCRGIYDSPDPFFVNPSNVRRLNLNKTHVECPRITHQNVSTSCTACDMEDDSINRTNVQQKGTCTVDCKNESDEDRDERKRENKRKEYRDNREDRTGSNCSCEDCSSSDESIAENKKKLRKKIIGEIKEFNGKLLSGDKICQTEESTRQLHVQFKDVEVDDNKQIRMYEEKSLLRHENDSIFKSVDFSSDVCTNNPIIKSDFLVPCTRKVSREEVVTIKNEFEEPVLIDGSKVGSNLTKPDVKNLDRALQTSVMDSVPEQGLEAIQINKKMSLTNIDSNLSRNDCKQTEINENLNKKCKTEKMSVTFDDTATDYQGIAEDNRKTIVSIHNFFTPFKNRKINKNVTFGKETLFFSNIEKDEKSNIAFSDSSKKDYSLKNQTVVTAKTDGASRRKNLLPSNENVDTLNCYNIKSENEKSSFGLLSTIGNKITGLVNKTDMLQMLLTFPSGYFTKNTIFPSITDSKEAKIKNRRFNQTERPGSEQDCSPDICRTKNLTSLFNKKIKLASDEKVIFVKKDSLHILTDRGSSKLRMLKHIVLENSVMNKVQIITDTSGTPTVTNPNVKHIQSMFGNPHKRQRNLLILSRFKDPQIKKDIRPRPYTIVKRKSKNNNTKFVLSSVAIVEGLFDVGYRLKNCKNFLSLKILEEQKNLAKNSLRFNKLLFNDNSKKSVLKTSISCVESKINPVKKLPLIHSFSNNT